MLRFLLDAVLALFLGLVVVPIVLSAQTTTESTLYSFTGGGDGAYPSALIQGSDGNFYGTTTFGGNAVISGSCHQGIGCGTIFRSTPSGGLTVLYIFTGGNDGAYPGPLVQGGDGNFYGAAVFGGSGACEDNSNAVVGCGTIFQITPSGNFMVLYSFGGGIDGSYPNSLIQGSDGNFYGTTVGTIFRMTPSGTLTT